MPNKPSGTRELWKLQKLFQHAWVEALAGAVIAVVLFRMGQHEMGVLAAILGAALSFGRWAFSKMLNDELEPVRELAAVVDLQREVTVPQIQELLRLHLSITEPEFGRVKDGIIREACKRLKRLADSKTSDELATTEYYEWLLPYVEQAPAGSRLWAISMMLTCEWDESPTERRFLESNLAAAKRGVHVERVFVVPHDQFACIRENAGVEAHAECTAKTMKPRIVDRDWLHKHDPNLLRRLGDGLIGFDERVVLIDVSNPAGEIRGRVIMNPDEVIGLRKMFDGLNLHATDLKPAPKVKTPQPKPDSQPSAPP